MNVLNTIKGKAWLIGAVIVVFASVATVTVLSYNRSTHPIALTQPANQTEQSTPVTAAQPEPTSLGGQTQERHTEIRLDFRPFTDPTSTFVLMRGNGQTQVVNYHTYRLVVTSVTQGSLPESQVTSLLRKIREPAFSEAMRHRKFGGTGLSQGDQFYLVLTGEGRADGEMAGFVPDAPEVVRSLVRDLLALNKWLDRSPLSEAYVRSRSIEKDHFEKLRREGRLRFISITDLPSDLQPVVSRAISRPGDFHPLIHAQYSRLLALTSHGHEFFVVEDHLGHQLTLYESGK